MKDLIYKVHGDYIEFIEYPYKCSLAYKNGKISTADIIDVAGNFFPPVIRTVNNELIIMVFTSEDDGEDKKLPRFYTDNNIKVRRDTIDIWDCILEPFIDTEFSEEHKERTSSLLEKYGISRAECDAIRQEVSNRMIAYNFTSGLWDWFHLGLAHNGYCVKRFCIICLQ